MDRSGITDMEKLRLYWQQKLHNHLGDDTLQLVRKPDSSQSLPIFTTAYNPDLIEAYTRLAEELQGIFSNARNFNMAIRHHSGLEIMFAPHETSIAVKNAEQNDTTIFERAMEGIQRG